MWAAIALCSVAVGGAGLARLATMQRNRSFGEGDAWVAATAVTVLAVLAGVFSADMPILSGFLLAGLALAGLAFVGLLIAVIAKRDVNDVGLLLPIYLLALGFFAYPLFGFAAANANLGGLC